MISGLGAWGNYSMPMSQVKYVTPINTDNTVNTSTPVESAVAAVRAGVTGEVTSSELIGKVDGKITGNSQVEKTAKSECQTCKERKYVDGSDEADVSFKAPGHISPESSYSKVMSHEQEHVSNAKQKTAKLDGELVSASISLKMACCPECGRMYVAGGTTKTAIKYQEKNPYEQARKTVEGSFFAGQNVDIGV